MVDFSHYSRISLPLYAKGLERGDMVTDHWFKSVLDAIDPPLFDEIRMRALYSELCWFEPRAHRGRPPNGSSREELAVAVDQLRRNDVPPAILKAISARLSQPGEKDRLRKPWRASMVRKRASRDSFIWSVYREFVAALVDGIEPIHPELATFVMKARPTRPPRAEALQLTQDFLRDKLKLEPPSLRRMQNIIGKKSSEFFVHLRGSERD